jgi:hypothetical protein
MQTTLSPSQLEAFYHDAFVRDQVNDFDLLIGAQLKAANASERVVVDLGGGVGYFANEIKRRFGYTVRVIDMDPVSIEKCRGKDLQADVGDVTALPPKGDEQVVCYNLILHHLVGKSSLDTYNLQSKALMNWKHNGNAIFVNEYIYESYIPGFSGWVIYKITSSQLLSSIGKLVSRVIKAFKANTFGTGVRFRSDSEWIALFANAGFIVSAQTIGDAERVAPPLRLLLIKSIKRNSYLLVAKA